MNGLYNTCNNGKKQKERKKEQSEGSRYPALSRIAIIFFPLPRSEMRTATHLTDNIFPLSLSLFRATGIYYFLIIIALLAFYLFPSLVSLKKLEYLLSINSIHATKDRNLNLIYWESIRN